MSNDPPQPPDLNSEPTPPDEALNASSDDLTGEDLNDDLNDDLNEDVWDEDSDRVDDASEPASLQQSASEPPLVPAPRVPASASRTTPQQLWQQVQPVVKTQTIQILKSTIRLLEGAVARLEAEPPRSNLPASTGVTTPEATSEVLPPAANAPSGSVAPGLSTDELWRKFRPWWAKAQVWWGKLLQWVRSRLPESTNQQLSDPVLSGAIVGVLVLLLWTTSALLPKSPPPRVAVAPSPRSVPTVSPAPSLAPSPQISPVPPVVKAPEPPTPVTPAPTPKPAPPPPPLNLTPEQKLIAAIQDQVAEVSDQYANGLIESVQANFKSSRLIVKVSDGWYTLKRSQQDKLAAEMLRRSKDLDFSKLEIADTDGTLLARSPVVGADMVILKRSQASDESAETV